MTYDQHMIRPALAALAALTLTGCSALMLPNEPTTPPMPCLVVSDDLAANIVGRGYTVTEAQAVKSPDYRYLYFIAIKFAGPGMGEGEVGVWASNAISGAGTVFSVDGFARTFTDWPDAGGIDVSATDPGVDAARACIG